MQNHLDFRRSFFVDPRNSKLNCRLQSNALIELLTSVYVFAKWPINRLSVEMKLHGCREANESGVIACLAKAAQEGSLR
jgi:hypothetical protein